MKIKAGQYLLVIACALFVQACGSRRSILMKTRIEQHTSSQEHQDQVQRDRIIVAVPAEDFKAGEFKRNLFGEHYRDTRAIPISIKQLDLGVFGGGLIPLRQDAGRQNDDLLLQGDGNNIYRFRKIEDDALVFFPGSFKKAYKEYPINAPAPSAHPYGALMIPDMAEAIGLSHTHPKLFYMPKSILPGADIQQFGEKLGIIEKTEDYSNAGLNGISGTFLSTSEMFRSVREDIADEIDAEAYLKNRLFDMFIGAYNRQEDKWMWERTKKADGFIYQPVSLDRDPLFNKFDGLVPKVLGKIFPEFQSFDADIKDPSILSLAARNIDRNILNQLSRSEWQRLAREIKEQLSDEVIQTAVARMPEEVYRLSGLELISKLKSRRDQLPAAADNYYLVLAKEVKIVGSDKAESFRIERLADSTRLTVYPMNSTKVNSQPLYNRTFSNSETKSLDIYALDGRDSIMIKGNSTGEGIKIRIIGGPGKDSFTDLSEERSFYYDLLTENNFVNKGKNTALRLSGSSHINDYEDASFNYDQKAVVPFFDLRAEDGIFIGGLFGIRHFGFRKSLASYTQTLGGQYAPMTGAYIIQYQGNFYSLFARNLDLVLNGSYNNPKYTFNYYGQGNSSLNIGDDKEYFRVRSRNLSVATFLQYRFSKAFRMGIGPGYESFAIETPADRYVSSPAFPEKNEIKPSSYYNTVRFYANLNLVDHELFPTKGVRWINQVAYFSGNGQTKENFTQLGSELSVYVSPDFSPVTLAIRVGGANNIGDYKFFQTNSLGGNTNLRGYRNNRFSGRSYLYQNTEIRYKALYFRDYVFSGDIGIFGFFDSGRVYSDLPETSNWHKGYGAGVWLNLYNKLIVSSSLGISPEGRYLTLKTGLFF